MVTRRAAVNGSGLDGRLSSAMLAALAAMLALGLIVVMVTTGV